MSDEQPTCETCRTLREHGVTDPSAWPQTPPEGCVGDPSCVHPQRVAPGKADIQRIGPQISDPGEISVAFIAWSIAACAVIVSWAMWIALQEAS